jgi:tRNA threonylcarbamoyladenosine biosynthesis protein TsaE
VTELIRQLPDETATLALGAALALVCREGAIIFLHGNLGAGKTTLARGFLQGLGHAGRVKSPTYTLVEPYEVAGRRIYHFDLYRLQDPEELDYLGLRDYLGVEAVCLVEWPERGEGALPVPDLEVNLAYADHARRALLRAGSPRGERLLARLAA